MPDQSRPPEPTVVAVLGSCATRDNFNRRFNPTYRESFECALAQNQTSIISLMSPPVLDEWRPLGKMSDYDRWNVRTDLTRSFLEDLAELQPAYLIVDFFADIHFGVIRLRDGRYVTDNRWKTRKTDWYQDLAEREAFERITIFTHTEEYLSLWKESFDRLVAFVRERTPDTRIVVHRGFNTNLISVPDRATPMRLRKRRPKISKLDVPRANQLWAQLDDHAIHAADGVEIDLTNTDWTTYEDHPWGPFYVHFPPVYNHRFLAELHKIVLADTQPAWVVQRMEEIDAARAELAAHETEAVDRRVEAMRARIAELRTNRSTAGKEPDSAPTRLRRRASAGVGRVVRACRRRLSH